MELLKAFEKNCLTAAETAENTLMSLLRDNADTEYGKKYLFSHIDSVRAYKGTVPFTEYKDYSDSISRMMHGEKNILTAYPLGYYSHTSGTVGASKLIPVSERAESLIHKYWLLTKELYSDYVHEKPSNMPKIPKYLYLITARGSNAPDGMLITNFSGKLLFDRKDVIAKIVVKPELLYCTEQKDLMYLWAFYALKERDLFNIHAPFTPSISNFFCYIENNWKRLCCDIADGALRPEEQFSNSLIEHLSADLKPDAKRADELRSVFSRGFDKPIASDIWPHFGYASGVGGASCSPYTQTVRRFIGKIPINMSSYAASEGMFAISVKMDVAEYALIPEAGYFEFIPEKDMDLPENELMERTLGINELRPEESYEIVITNLSGLYRYRIGDVITVKGRFGQSPIISFGYRRHQILNIVGEKTNDDMIMYTINAMREQMGITVVGWSVCEDSSTSPARYQMFMEIEPFVSREEQQKMRDILEEKLSEASEYYRDYRHENKIGPMELILLKPNTYALYRDIQIKNGASSNQLKPIHRINDSRTKAFFRGQTAKKSASRCP